MSNKPNSVLPTPNDRPDKEIIDQLMQPFPRRTNDQQNEDEDDLGLDDLGLSYECEVFRLHGTPTIRYQTPRYPETSGINRAMTLEELVARLRGVVSLLQDSPDNYDLNDRNEAAERVLMVADMLDLLGDRLCE